MAHMIEKEQYFVFRTKDITSKWLIGNFVFPDSDTFDITVDVTLTRSHRKSIKIKDVFYRRYIDQAASFDYIKYGSEDTYECLVTNLPEKTFLLKSLKRSIIPDGLLCRYLHNRPSADILEMPIFAFLKYWIYRTL